MKNTNADPNGDNDNVDQSKIKIENQSSFKNFMANKKKYAKSIKIMAGFHGETSWEQDE